MNAAVFRTFVAAIVTSNDEYLFNDGPEEQIARAVAALEKFSTTTPLRRVDGRWVDLAGFGDAPIHFEAADDRYLLLSQVAEQLGVPIWDACKWAEHEHQWAIRDQRDQDEERGDGLLGYDCLRNFVDLKLDFVQDNPEAKPDANGKRWSDYGDWLISHDRLPAFIMVSPWGREFMNNTMDHFGHTMRKVWGDKLNDLTAYRADGTPAPGVELFASDLTEEEALRKARRGPTGGLDGVA
ncbi:hypothetical protein AB0J28_09575 [Streptosporangium canum]|uniref:hypothetical protein n=1 Tax=Streptosporangium canum TaxID=324952 RepID=UPI0034290596